MKSHCSPICMPSMKARQYLVSICTWGSLAGRIPKSYIVFFVHVARPSLQHLKPFLVYQSTGYIIVLLHARAVHIIICAKDAVLLLRPSAIASQACALCWFSTQTVRSLVEDPAISAAVAQFRTSLEVPPLSMHPPTCYMSMLRVLEGLHIPVTARVIIAVNSRSAIFDFGKYIGKAFELVTDIPPSMKSILRLYIAGSVTFIQGTLQCHIVAHSTEDKRCAFGDRVSI
jgi:hypothetical protein